MTLDIESLLRSERLFQTRSEGRWSETLEIALVEMLRLASRLRLESHKDESHIFAISPEVWREASVYAGLRVPAPDVIAPIRLFGYLVRVDTRLRGTDLQVQATFG